MFVVSAVIVAALAVAAMVLAAVATDDIVALAVLVSLLLWFVVSHGFGVNLGDVGIAAVVDAADVAVYVFVALQL